MSGLIADKLALARGILAGASRTLMVLFDEASRATPLDVIFALIETKKNPCVPLGVS
jgi:hypothetical protein